DFDNLFTKKFNSILTAIHKLLGGQLKYFIETACFKTDYHFMHTREHSDPAGAVIGSRNKMSSTEFQTVTIIDGKRLVQSNNQTLGNLREKDVFNKTVLLICGNDQIRIHTMPEGKMRVKREHMKHIPLIYNPC